MFREGPFPVFVHGLVEYVAGALFIALPLLLGYDSGAATAVSIIIGVVLIGVAASTDWGLSLNNQIPKAAHFAVDWVLAAVMIASPFLFGFSDETAPTAIFIAAGVLQILLTIGTRFGAKPDSERQARAKSGSSKVRAAADDRPRERRFVGEGDAAATPQPPANGAGDRRTARRS
jgi:low affinity Fe/Cu permease